MSLLCMLLFACSVPDTEDLDYRNDRLWLALPTTQDAADMVPSAEGLPQGSVALLVDGQDEGAGVDVFYLHPTVDLATLGVRNAPLDDAVIEEIAVDSVRYQASAFNLAGRVFAPKYRSASLMTYAVNVGERNQNVLDRAYQDVVDAFDEYLDHRSGGRGFILVGHSQGASHLVQLLNDRIDGTALQDRLVAAYVLGEFVGEDTFNTLPMCDASDAVGCVASWATVRDGARPAMACGSADLSECIKPTINTHSTPVCTNPLTWELGGQAAASMNLGAGPGRGMGSGLLDPLYPGLVDARCADDGTLRIDDTLESGEMRASQFADVDGGDYHVQDLNLFWLNVRENAAERAAAYLD